MVAEDFQPQKFLLNQIATAYTWHLLLTLFVAISVASANSPLQGTNISGLEIYPMDLISLLMALHLLIFAFRTRQFSLPLLTLFMLLSVSVIRGFGTYGIEEVGNSSRQPFYTLIAIGFSLVGYSTISADQIARVWRCSALVLSAFAIVYFVRFGFGTYASRGERALSAPHTLVLTHATLFTMQKIRSRWDQLFLAIFFFVLLNSQQRTVWFASVIALGAFLIATVGIRRRPSVKQIGQSALLVLLAQILVFALPNVLSVGQGEQQSIDGPDNSSESLGAPDARSEREDALDSFYKAGTEMSFSSGNFGWRLHGLQILLSDYGEKNFPDQLIGQPMAEGFDRMMYGGLVEVSPHNMYVYVLISFGLLGLVALMWLFYDSLRGTWRRNPAVFSIVVSLIVFSLGYEIHPEHGIFLGLGIASMAPKAKRNVA